MGVGGQRYSPAQEKDPVPIVQEAGSAAGPVSTSTENFTRTGIRTPNRPAHSDSLPWTTVMS